MTFGWQGPWIEPANSQRSGSLAIHPEMKHMKAWLIAKKTDLITAAIVIGIVLLLIVVVPYCC
ncbi:MAG: hypothetical protein EPN64_19270 [Burkholderiaceae bacterium]|nr:MAG: hypothetical protein EPN64_19270 [Burkholderiaceae bacterium]